MIFVIIIIIVMQYFYANERFKTVDEKLLLFCSNETI